eukprot:TRINITY_DN21992_c0_g1_i1.p1 TRINITY_DN21992_c0_g1~~TRINITY_DN21992_c0_g1_i1.p1  ORF type:complete len:261 (+),score=58.25 TRINITY_DN21992_c0_g1_i1:84-785(+)
MSAAAHCGRDIARGRDGTPQPAAWATQHDFLFKVLVIGDAGVGKTSLVRRFVEDEFTESYIATIGVDFKVRSLDVGGTLCKLQVWDTAGQERFRTITGGYYRGANGVVVVYDVTDEMSFDSVEQWLAEIDRNNCPSSAQRVLVGNKIDESSRRVVPRDDGRRLADTVDVGFFECSAKDGTGVAEAFQALAERMLKRTLADGPAARAQPLAGLPATGLAQKPDAQGKRRGTCKC